MKQIDKLKVFSQSVALGLENGLRVSPKRKIILCWFFMDNLSGIMLQGRGPEVHLVQFRQI